MVVTLPRLVTTLLCALTFCSCGDDASYETANVELAAPVTDMVDVLIVDDVSSESYCQSDACPSGNDGTITSISFTLQQDTTVDNLAQVLIERLPDWSVTRIDCQSEESDCNGIAAMTLDRGDASLYIDVFSDSTGTILADREG